MTDTAPQNEKPVVRFDVTDGIGVITIDYPPVNALGPGVGDGIIAALDKGEADPEVKALSKRMRIEANLKYLTRNHQSTNEKTIDQVEARKKELDKWGVDYAEAPGKNS